jgi:putative ABC transport system permease protein
MPSLARKNLFEDIPRFLVAQAGIMFAVSLVTIQTGILNGFIRSTGLLIERSQADIWVASKDMVQMELTLPIPAANVEQVRKVPGVSRAEALMLGAGTWRVGGDAKTPAKISPVRFFGFNPDGKLFQAIAPTEGSLANLKAPFTVITDAANLDNLNLTKVGDSANIGTLPVQVVGLTKDSQSTASSTFLFTSLENAKVYITGGRTANLNCRIVNEDFLCTNVYDRSAAATAANVRPTPLTATDTISFILVQAKAGEDLQVLKQRINQAIPEVRALTRTEMAERTREYWVKRTGIGFTLGLGASVGVIVGVVIVGQILYSSVSDHLKEFATLKAMGVNDRVIYGIIVQQALFMAVLGYIPSLLLCLGLSALTFATQGITILITPLNAAGIFGLTVFMCTGSALFAIQKVTRVDPAIVFKS